MNKASSNVSIFGVFYCSLCGQNVTVKGVDVKYLKKGQTRGETGTYPESNQALVDIRHGMCEQQHNFPFDVWN